MRLLYRLVVHEAKVRCSDLFLQCVPIGLAWHWRLNLGQTARHFTAIPFFLPSPFLPVLWPTVRDGSNRSSREANGYERVDLLYLGDGLFDILQSCMALRCFPSGNLRKMALTFNEGIDQIVRYRAHGTGNQKSQFTDDTGMLTPGKRISLSSQLSALSSQLSST